MPLALGPKARTEEMTCDVLRVKHIEQGETKAEDGHHLQFNHLAIGEHATNNTCKMKSKGSILFFEYKVLLNGTKLTTANNNSNVTIKLSASHGLSANDTVKISNVEGLPYAGIPAGALDGTFTLKAGTSGADIVVDTTHNATSTSELTAFLCDLECTVYKSIDLHSSATSFTRSTTEPASTYANVEVA